MDLDTLVASEPALEVGKSPEPANDETVLSPVITVEPQTEETTQVTDEIDDHLANETISFLLYSVDLEEEEQQPAKVPRKLHNHSKHRRWFILEIPKQMEDNKDVTKN